MTNHQNFKVNPEIAWGVDSVALRQLHPITEDAVMRKTWCLHKFLDRAHPNRLAHALRAGAPRSNFARFLTETPMVIHGNCLLNEGINELFTLIAGTGAVKWDSGNAYTGVGDSATAADAGQTALQAAGNKLYVAMDGGYPTYGSSQKATWRSSFAAAQANFAWAEITVSNTSGGDTGKNLNRKVQAMGTKASPAVWTPSLEISLT